MKKVFTFVAVIAMISVAAQADTYVTYSNTQMMTFTNQSWSAPDSTLNSKTDQGSLGVDFGCTLGTSDYGKLALGATSALDWGGQTDFYLSITLISASGASQQIELNPFIQTSSGWVFSEYKDNVVISVGQTYVKHWDLTGIANLNDIKCYGFQLFTAGNVILPEMMNAVVRVTSSAPTVSSSFGSGWPGYGGAIDEIRLLYNGGSVAGFAQPAVTVTNIWVNWDDATGWYGEGDANKWSETYNDGKMVIFKGIEAPAYGLEWTANFVNPVVGDTLSIRYYSSISPITPPFSIDYSWTYIDEYNGWDWVPMETAPEPVAVALVPNAMHVAPGSTVTVSVNMSVSWPITMAAISTRILYDPNVFTYDANSGVLKGNLLTHYWDLGAGNPAEGELRVGGIDLGIYSPEYFETLAAGGSGKLFTFSLKAKEDAPMGPSALTWGVYDGYDNATAGFDYGDKDFVDVILPLKAMSGASIMVCPAGDLDGDCDVDFLDFAIMANNWLVGTE